MENKTDNQTSELEMLKERARQMGIPVKGNVGVETLKARINDRLNGTKTAVDEDDTENDTDEATDDDVVDDDDDDDDEVADAPAPKSRKPKRKRPETEQEIRQRLKKEKMKLLRCRIYNLNPGKRDLHGEIITVGNRYLGTVRKFIPFGEATENGYHIPQVIYDDLKGRRFQEVRVVKKGPGKEEVKTRMIPEYNIEILPMLTKEELSELAMRQAATERLGGGE